MNKKIKKIAITLTLLIISCKNSDIKHVINRFEQKAVVMNLDSLYKLEPSNSITVKRNILKTWKYVVFIESSECSVCNLNNLCEWVKMDDFFLKNKERLTFIIILESKEQNLKLISESINDVIKDYVYVDENNYFRINNPTLPKQTFLHSFLLDSDNNVILVGNIMNNNNVRILFEKILYENGIIS